MSAADRGFAALQRDLATVRAMLLTLMTPEERTEVTAEMGTKP